MNSVTLKVEYHDEVKKMIFINQALAKASAQRAEAQRVKDDEAEKVIFINQAMARASAQRTSHVEEDEETKLAKSILKLIRSK
jgi:hypothetical protein